jgi:hypothetical protein
MALVTTAEAREALQLSSASDTYLDTLVSRAGVLLAQHCGYPSASVGTAPTMESTSYTRYSGDPGIYVDCDNPRLLYLEPYPVTAITSIHDDTLEAFGSGAEVDSDQWSQRGKHGHIIRLNQSSSQGLWTAGDGFIKVVFTAGYSTVDGALKAATLETVAYLHNLRKRRGQSSLSEQERVTAYRHERLPDRVQDMVSDYVLPSALM